MTSVLSEIQAGYEARAKQAARPVVSSQDAPQYHFATRTYTGQPLERRRAWGREYGDILRQKRLQRQMREAETSV